MSWFSNYMTWRQLSHGGSAPQDPGDPVTDFIVVLLFVVGFVGLFVCMCWRAGGG